jgi:hypothetical protein
MNFLSDQVRLTIPQPDTTYKSQYGCLSKSIRLYTEKTYLGLKSPLEASEIIPESLSEFMDLICLVGALYECNRQQNAANGVRHFFALDIPRVILNRQTVGVDSSDSALGISSICEELVLRRREGESAQEGKAEDADLDANTPFLVSCSDLAYWGPIHISTPAFCHDRPLYKGQCDNSRRIGGSLHDPPHVAFRIRGHA